MSEWKCEKIGELCDVSSSKRIYYSDYVNDGVPFYRSKEIIELSNCQSITESLFISKNKYISIRDKYGVPQKGDLLLTSVGTIGVPYYVNNDHAFYFKDGNLTWFRNFSKSLNSKYLYYWFESDIGKSILNNITIGSSQKALTISSLKNLTIPVPPIEKQLKIVQMLSNYDELIGDNNHQISLLEEAAQRLYKEWFVDLHFPGYENFKIVDGVPQGWKRVNLGSLFTIIRGKSYTSKELSDSEGVQLVNLSNMKPYGGYIRNSEKRFIGKYKTQQEVTENDLIMGVTDMTQERRTVSRVALVPDLKSKAIISMDLLRLIPKQGSTLFYYHMFKDGGYSELISQFANGTNVLHLRPEVLNLIDCVLPTNKLQNMFSSTVKPVYNEIDKLEDEINILEESRDRLLPKLMSGEIEV